MENTRNRRPSTRRTGRTRRRRRWPTCIAMSEYSPIQYDAVLRVSFHLSCLSFNHDLSARGQGYDVSRPTLARDRLVNRAAAILNDHPHPHVR